MFRRDILSELEFDMSRLETEQGCSSENCSLDTDVLSSYGSLPDTLATVACGLDLAAMATPTPVAANEVTVNDAIADSTTADDVTIKDEPAAQKATSVVETETKLGSSTNSGRSKYPTQSRSASKMAAPPRKLAPSRSSAIWATLRSRRVRMLLTLVGVLMIAGLVGLNLRSSRSATDVDDMDLEMSEFGQGVSTELAAPTDSLAAPASFDDGFENNPIATSDANEWETLPNRLPPLGLSPTDDSGVISAGGVERASMLGPRGAWLTGQIELESSGIVPVSGFRSSARDRK